MQYISYFMIKVAPFSDLLSLLRSRSCCLRGNVVYMVMVISTKSPLAQHPGMSWYVSMISGQSL